MPTLSLFKGIGNLGPGARVFALVMLGFLGVVFMSPKRDALANGTVPDRSTITQERQEVPKNASPVRADKMGDSNSKSAKIVTCPRCRLNSLPRVKEFVYDHAKLFEPNLKVDFILGEDPVLHLYDDGKEVEEIDLEVSLAHVGLLPQDECNMFLSNNANNVCVRVSFPMLKSYDSKKIIQKLVQFGIHPSTESDVIKEALANS